MVQVNITLFGGHFAIYSDRNVQLFCDFFQKPLYFRHLLNLRLELLND